MADLGHTAATEQVHLEWTKRLEAEFYTQGDKERDLGLKISPLMDRNSVQTGISKSQVFAGSLCIPPAFRPSTGHMQPNAPVTNCSYTLDSMLNLLL